MIFSAVYAVLLHPLPYFEPERLVSLTGSDLSRPGGHEVEISFGDFREWERRNHVLAGGRCTRGGLRRGRSAGERRGPCDGLTSIWH